MDWQTIESAPTDGTHFLGFHETYGICEAWCSETPDEEGGLFYWDFVVWPFHGCGCCYSDCAPTHWMPLPEPPK